MELTTEVQQSADYDHETSVIATDAARMAEEGGHLVGLVSIGDA